MAGDGLNDTKCAPVFSFFFTKLHPDFLHQRLFVQGNGGEFFPCGFLVVGQHFDNVAAAVLRVFQRRHAATRNGEREKREKQEKQEKQEEQEEQEKQEKQEKQERTRENKSEQERTKRKDKKKTTFKQKSVFTSHPHPPPVLHLPTFCATPF